jgi:hypothetical protein
MYFVKTTVHPGRIIRLQLTVPADLNASKKENWTKEKQKKLADMDQLGGKLLQSRVERHFLKEEESQFEEYWTSQQECSSG